MIAPFGYLCQYLAEEVINLRVWRERVLMSWEFIDELPYYLVQLRNMMNSDHGFTSSQEEAHD